MKLNTTKLKLTGLLLGLGLPFTSFGQTAKVQAIHNSPDPAAAVVDVWFIEGGTASKLIPSFAFRQASAFTDVNAGVPITLALAPANSTSVSDTIPGASITATLAADENYVIAAMGNVGTGFAANPDGINNGFGFKVITPARLQSSNPAQVEFLVLHGSPDAPTVDVYAQGLSTPLVDDAPYNANTGYMGVSPAVYYLDITPSSGSPALFTFKADLSGLAGGAAVVFASGYVDPSANNGGEAFGLFAALPNGTVVQFDAPTAKVQVIHNSADPAAATVDVWAQWGINSIRLIDDFSYTDATAYIDVPAQTDLKIIIAPGNSTSPAQGIYDQTFNLPEGLTAAVMALGNVGSGFAANPDGLPTNFRLQAILNTRTQAANSGEVDLMVVHGSTDAPTVDIYAQGLATPLVDNAPFAANTPYLNLAPASYYLDITPAAGSPALFTYKADISSLAGGAGIAFASGFVSPDNNNSGAPFGVYVALANGTVIKLEAPTARVQAIHNSADPAAGVVDVWAEWGINSVRLVDDFRFSEATPFIDVPAQTDLKIIIAPRTSTSAAQGIYNQTFNLPEGTSAVLMALGNVGTGFAPNPSGVNNAFRLAAFTGAREQANNPTEVDVMVVHGSADAPAVDAYVRGLATPVVSNLAFAQNSPYLGVAPADYTFLLTPAGVNQNVYAFKADLSGLAGGAAVVFASGYVNSANNNAGDPFFVYAALPDGNVLELDIPYANVQIIHNSPAPAAANVDVYVNAGLIIRDWDGLEFRQATEYLEFPALIPTTIGFAAAGSNGIQDTIPGLSTTLTLEEDENYIVLAQGNIGTGFAANPDGINTNFGLKVITNARQSANNSSQVEFVIVHGAPDAPTVDVLANNSVELANDLRYNDNTPYIGVAPASYAINLTSAARDTTIVTFRADLSSLAGATAVVFASGYLDPSANNNGLAFGLFAALEDGTVIALPVDPGTSISRLTVNNMSLYPNPANKLATLSFESEVAGSYKVVVKDQQGRVVRQINEEISAGINKISISVEGLASGLYLVEHELSATPTKLLVH